MLETLITSKTRIRLLHTFFLNAQNEAYLRGLESELGESTNSIRIELNRLLRARLLLSVTRGNKRFFRANPNHAYFEDLQQIVRKEAGIPEILETLQPFLNSMQAIYLSGDLSKGIPTDIVDLILVGKPDQKSMLKQFSKLEKLKSRKFRFILFNQLKDKRLHKLVEEENPLLLWERKK